MIRFNSIKFKNFLSTGNHFTILELNRVANTLIVGENGSGKSTMLDALCFGLFGKPFRKINKPQLMNSINQKDCVVEIEFAAGNKSYKVIRGIKPNIFEIYCNSQKVDQNAAAKDYQDYFEKHILKLNFKSFTQIVILGSASFTPFMQLSAADRRAIIEDLLDIQIFSSMNSIVKIKLNENKDNLEGNKLLIESCNEKIEMQKRYISEIKQNNDELILSYQSELSNNTIDITNLKTLIEKENQTIRKLSSQCAEKKTIESKIKKLTQLEAQIESTVSKLKKEIGFFHDNDNCPTCRQGIQHNFKLTQIEKNKNKLSECEEALSKLEEKIKESNDNLVSVNNVILKVSECENKIAIHNASIDQITKANKRLDDKINQLKTSKISSNKESDVLNFLVDNLQDLQDKRKTLLDNKTYLEAASILLKDSGIKTKIVKQYLPIINKLVNKYLMTMDFFVNFSLDESFKETIKSRHRDEFSYESFSEGEKQRIDMALMLTWRSIAKLKNSANTNLLILDEIFDSSLDSTGTEDLMKILQMLDGVNLFIISHKGDVLQDKFSNVIRFQKIQNFSRMIT